MDNKAMYSLSYGLFVVTAREGEKDNGCITNTVMQVTTTPCRISVTINKGNYTHDMIARTGIFNVSILSEKADFGIFKHWGFQSGRDTDKVAATGLTPVPLESGAMTFAEARLTIEGRKLFKSPMQESHFLDAEILERWYGAHGGLHDVYVVEIENVYEG